MSKIARKIGITIFCRKERTDRGEGAVGWWSNGANQNCVFLWLCLTAAGLDVVLVNGGDGESPAPEALPQEFRAARWVKISDEVCDSLDVLIQAGAQVSAEHVARVHARGGRAIVFKFGSDYPIDAERAVHGLPSGSIFNGSVFDEIWTTLQHKKVCGTYWEINYRAPVRILPHIWSPAFADHLANDLSRIGIRPGYVPGRARKRIVILEPNLQLIKTCHIPMLICEDVWRREPATIDRVLVTNAIELKKNEAFATFAKNLDIAKALAADGHPVMSFEARYNTPWLMATQGDIVVSHQWIPVANYSHYDLLHLGYPIVHNCTDMPVGYFYPDFDALAGAYALRSLIANHDQSEIEKSDRAAGRRWLRSRIATSRENVDVHARAIEEAFR